MKNIIRNDLWMVIVAWCLLLNNYSILGMGVGVLATIYTAYCTKHKNYWRVLAISLVFFSLNVIFARLTVIYNFNYFTFFSGIISLNVAFLNERLYRERLRALYPIFLIMFVCLIINMLIAIIIPANLVLAKAKADLFGLIIIVFIPYTSIMLISLIVKEYRMKEFLEQQRAIRKTKML